MTDFTIPQTVSFPDPFDTSEVWEPTPSVVFQVDVASSGPRQIGHQATQPVEARAERRCLSAKPAPEVSVNSEADPRGDEHTGGLPQPGRQLFRSNRVRVADEDAGARLGGACASSNRRP